MQTIKIRQNLSGPNGEVRYSINRRQSDAATLFSIDSLSGLLTVNRRLDFESRDRHEVGYRFIGAQAEMRNHLIVFNKIINSFIHNNIQSINIIMYIKKKHIKYCINDHRFFVLRK